ncbi:MAG: Transposase [Lactobacillus delbrueckii]
MPKKTEKAKRNKQIGTLTDKQKYEAKILEKDARIKELELELIIAKKWPPGIHAIQSTKGTDNL